MPLNASLSKLPKVIGGRAKDGRFGDDSDDGQYLLKPPNSARLPANSNRAQQPNYGRPQAAAEENESATP